MAIKNRKNKIRKTLNIRITKIARRTCRDFLNHCNCLLATSVKRQFPTVKQVHAGFSWIRIDGIIYDVKNPTPVSNAYDQGPEKFTPFVVKLNIDESACQGI